MARMLRDAGTHVGRRSRRKSRREWCGGPAYSAAAACHANATRVPARAEHHGAHVITVVLQSSRGLNTGLCRLKLGVDSNVYNAKLKYVHTSVQMQSVMWPMSACRNMMEIFDHVIERLTRSMGQLRERLATAATNARRRLLQLLADIQQQIKHKWARRATGTAVCRQSVSPLQKLPRVSAACNPQRQVDNDTPPITLCHVMR
ncbi:hypothetical protein JKP88DRAFT_242557 [Tribonema minus]|uniref:Uncharacterized protein n=1 Tax=Tribonema minus TaxID=303371 RepID=A0A836C7N7_9STRA|nr:hypothetical protein JKP88DRAFT_242557 [Tribonema minus]